MTSSSTVPALRRWALRFAAPLIGLLVLAGCDSGASDAEPAAATDDPIEVELVDFAFEGLPNSAAAGSRFTVVNSAESELHELVAFRLPDDDDRSVEELAELPPGELIGALGEPATVILAAPGGDAIFAVGDGTLDEPGRYAIMCFIPTGVAPDVYLEAAAESEEGPPDVGGGPPHFVHGMHAELQID